jgi:hypothetical protein
MNRNNHPPDDSWQSDAVWKLLDQVPPATASPRFVDATARAARLDIEAKSWWSRLISPSARLAGLAASAAAVVLAVTFLGTSPKTDFHAADLNSSHAAAIQEIAETETLIAALDQLDDFSDYELVSLIGF